MRYVYEACNPTIVNLSTDQNMISLGLLDYRLTYKQMYYQSTSIKINLRLIYLRNGSNILCLIYLRKYSQKLQELSLTEIMELTVNTFQGALMTVCSSYRVSGNDSLQPSLTFDNSFRDDRHVVSVVITTNMETSLTTCIKSLKLEKMSYSD